MEDLISNEDGDEGKDVHPFVFFQLIPNDDGDVTGRTSTSQFQNKTPVCIEWASDFKSLTLTITNVGLTASDLIVVDYRIIFCIADWHGFQDGFTTSHADEAVSNEFDKWINAATVPALEQLDLKIDFPEGIPRDLYNIYVKARISTLWEPTLPFDQWDFETDLRVTEGHVRVAP